MTMRTFNANEFLTSIKTLENKDLYFSGSEYSWASDEEFDETYGDLVCSYDEFVGAVKDYIIDGNNKELCRISKTKHADFDSINDMVSNENIGVELEEIDE
jgi:hypothetical protein